jgi:hypothetical protein
MAILAEKALWDQPLKHQEKKKEKNAKLRLLCRYYRNVKTMQHRRQDAPFT